MAAPITSRGPICEWRQKVTHWQDLALDPDGGGMKGEGS